jgi:hypothetical protein
VVTSWWYVNNRWLRYKKAQNNSFYLTSKIYYNGHSRHIWIEFVIVFLPCFEGFSLGSLVFLPPSIPKKCPANFQFDLRRPHVDQPIAVLGYLLKPNVLCDFELFLNHLLCTFLTENSIFLVWTNKLWKQLKEKIPVKQAINILHFVSMKKTKSCADVFVLF